MSHVEFKKWSCCYVEFSGPDLLQSLGVVILNRMDNFKTLYKVMDFDIELSLNIKKR